MKKRKCNKSRMLNEAIFVIYDFHISRASRCGVCTRSATGDAEQIKKLTFILDLSLGSFASNTVGVARPLMSIEESSSV